MANFFTQSTHTTKTDAFETNQSCQSGTELLSMHCLVVTLKQFSSQCWAMPMPGEMSHHQVSQAGLEKPAGVYLLRTYNNCKRRETPRGLLAAAEAKHGTVPAAVDHSLFFGSIKSRGVVKQCQQTQHASVFVCCISKIALANSLKCWLTAFLALIRMCDVPGPASTKPRGWGKILEAKKRGGGRKERDVSGPFWQTPAVLAAAAAAAAAIPVSNADNALISRRATQLFPLCKKLIYRNCLITQ